MRLPALLIACAALLLVIGCGSKAGVNKEIAPPALAQGWKVAKVDGLPATVSVPEDFTVQRGPAAGTLEGVHGLSQNLPSLLAIRQRGENVEGVTITAVEGKDPFGEKEIRDAAQGFVDTFKKEGHGVSNYTSEFIDLPIGRAQKGRFAMTLKKGDGHTTAYFVADGNRLYSLSITTSDESKIDHDAIAKSLRITK